MAQTTLEEIFDDGRSPRCAERAELNAERYTSAMEKKREWEGVWTRTWLFAGLASDVPDVGDYFLYEIGEESIVITRDESPELRGFVSSDNN